MDNYYENRENEYYDNPYIEVAKTNKNKYIIIGITIIILIIIVLFVVKLLSSGNSYKGLEKKMEKEAIGYVTKIGIFDKEIYIDSSKMNINLPDNCNRLSGVFYDNGKYTPYLVCSDYKSKFNNSEVLNGETVILLPKNSNYYELGYNSQIEYQISGVVNTNQEGVYNVYYIPKDGKNYETRKVVIIDNSSVSSYLPEITFNDNIELKKGQSYESNLTAYDKIDGDITSKVIKIENVNINEIGEYKNIYSVTNSLGYTVMSRQSVSVYNELEMSILAELSESNVTNKNVVISIKVKGDKFNSLILPDKTETPEKEYSYEVEKNGEYEFVAVDKNGERVSKIVKVDNIDKTIPVGTCKATLYNDKTVFNVNITSPNSITGYNYFIDSNGSGYLTNNNHTTIKTTSKNLSVVVKDYIGNEASIKCTIEDKKTYFDPKGYRKVLIEPPRLTIPITQALAKKGYTFEQFNKCIYDRVVNAGPYTRYGVAAAAYGLIECSYTMTGFRLPYSHTASMVGDEKSCRDHADICGKLGASPRWGSPGGQCGVKSDGTKPQCYQGHNCATFVHWSMCNGGMDLCSRGDNTAFGMADIKFFPEADAVGIKGQKVNYVYGVDYSNLSADTLVRKLKPGDIVASSEGDGHVFVVVGYDDNGIYTAEDGYFMRNLKYSVLTNGKESYRLMFLDRYYANSKNRNNLYG